MKQFKVISEFEVKGRKVLGLDKPRTLEEYGTRHILCHGKEYSYKLTHNDRQIIVEADDGLLGKMISFVA